MADNDDIRTLEQVAEMFHVTPRWLRETVRALRNGDAPQAGHPCLMTTPSKFEGGHAMPLRLIRRKDRGNALTIVGTVDGEPVRRRASSDFPATAREEASSA